MRRRQWISSGMLLLTAIIWGFAFVSQKSGMQYVGPFTYNCVRYVLGGGALLALLPALDRLRSRRSGGFERGGRWTILAGGVLCGVVLFAASSLQQFGILYQDAQTNVGKAGFITACYTVIVPILYRLTGRKSPAAVWIGAGLALAGFFSLSMMDGLLAGHGLRLDLSDLLLFLCAVLFSVHILVIDRFSPLADGVRLSCVQFFTAGLLCLPWMAILEKPAPSDVLAAAVPIGYAGLFSCGVAYTLQVVAQKDVHPAVASLLLSLESVFSMLAGYLLLPGSSLTAWEAGGCALVFAAVVLVELSDTVLKSQDGK